MGKTKSFLLVLLHFVSGMPIDERDGKHRFIPDPNYFPFFTICKTVFCTLNNRHLHHAHSRHKNYCIRFHAFIRYPFYHQQASHFLIIIFKGNFSTCHGTRVYAFLQGLIRGFPRKFHLGFSTGACRVSTNTIKQ